MLLQVITRKPWTSSIGFIKVQVWVTGKNIILCTLNAFHNFFYLPDAYKALQLSTLGQESFLKGVYKNFLQISTMNEDWVLLLLHFFISFSQFFFNIVWTDQHLTFLVFNGNKEIILLDLDVGTSIFLNAYY